MHLIFCKIILLQTGAGSNTTNTYVNDGTYDVSLTITTAFGCTTVIDSLAYVLVHPKPAADFTASPNPVSSLSPFVSFTDLSTVTITNWAWNFGDLTTTADVSIAQNPVYQLLSSVHTTILIRNN